MRQMVLVGILCYLLLQLTVRTIAFAEPFEQQPDAAKAGLVVLSGITTIPYGIAKLAFATVGSVVGGAINLLSLGYASDTAGRIALGAADGDWYVHPDVFMGERPLRFIGPGSEIEEIPLPVITQREGE